MKMIIENNENSRSRVSEYDVGFREQDNYSQIIEFKNRNSPLWKDGKEATTQEEIGGFPT